MFIVFVNKTVGFPDPAAPRISVGLLFNSTHSINQSSVDACYVYIVCVCWLEVSPEKQRSLSDLGGKPDAV